MITAIGEGTRLRGGRYTLKSRVGRGGAATVWLADDTVLDRPVAVKVLSEALASDESWLARFRREARVAARLSHPHLVSIYDFDAGGERPYIVMAFMPGGSLWNRMQKGESSEPERLARDLMSALEAIHSAGIIHRDIKPGNVLFDAHGAACLTDFGVARPEDATSLTRTGEIPGTAKFMAPELWKGEPASERSDLYAAGVLLREAIGNDASPEVVALAERLSADEASERPASAAAALDELDGPPETPAPAGEGAWTGEPSPRTVVTQANNRSRRGAAIAGVATLAVVAALAISQAIGDGGDDGDAGRAGGNSELSASGRDAAKGAGSGGDADKPDTGGGREPGSQDQGSGQGSTTPVSDQDAGGGSAVPVSVEPPIDPVALDQEGKALIDAGNPEAAIPILQRAVDYYPEDSQDINYAYSLYNLGHALLLAGRADEAIPYLEKRLTFADQRETVQQTLDEARAAATDR